MSEMLVVEIPSDTRRRLELMGFPYDISGRDIACFLIEQGLAVLEKHRGAAEPEIPRKLLSLG
jgi:hypothetical protein